MSETLSKSDAVAFVRSFGARRGREGDEFCEADYLPGQFFYATGDNHCGISVWGDEYRWSFSAYSAARVNMQPTLELYRYVSRWRTTNPFTAPYVIEDGGAAVLCEKTYFGHQMYSEATAWRLMVAAIDLIGESASTIGKDLAQADGVPFTARGNVGLTLLSSWWEISDKRIASILELN